MKIVKKLGTTAIVKYNKGEGFEYNHQYGVILHFFDKNNTLNDYSPFDCDLVCETLSKAVELAKQWTF